MSLARVLLVDDNDAIRTTMQKVLELNNFEVVSASSVNEALSYIAAEKFGVLLCDLHMPGRGDGLTVVSAMRHANANALTLVFSGYPEMKEALSAILVQADEILVKPLDIPSLIKLITKRLASSDPSKTRVLESVATILERECGATIQDWLLRVQHDKELTRIPLSFAERTGHLPQLLRDLVLRLRRKQKLGGDSDESDSAWLHGKLRHTQGYSAAMLVEESRMLQVSIFQTLQSHLTSIDFSLLLLDVMCIADEVDSQLAQTMRSYSAEESARVAA
ncbi:MAG: response regulator [Terriglobales bacterium]